MICGTCGRDNAPNLVFCQDCGARLGPRIAPPTPAILPAYDISPPPRVPSDVLPTPGPSRAIEGPIDDIDALLGTTTKSDPPKEPRSRPSAPNFDFSPRDNKAEEQPTRSRCSRCGSSNAPHIRYCLACGNQLRASMGPGAPQSVRPQMLEAAAANPPPESRRDPSQAPKAADQPIAPVPVLGVGNAIAATNTIRICSRCRGVCESTAQFCKFCGASLADATVSSRQAPPPSTRDARVERSPGLDAPKPERSAPPPLPEPARQPASEAPLTPVVPSDVSREKAAASRSVAPAATKHRGRLIVIAKDGGEGESYPIDDRLDIGRTEGDVLVADDGYLSPRHARISWRGRLVLRDLGSVNGVYLRLAQKSRPKDDRGNPAGASPAETNSKKLEDQDLILLGQQVIRFEVVKDAEEGLGPASQHGTLVFGTPVAPRYARLCLRTVEGVTRDVYYLGKRETILGRESGDIIFAEDPFLSRRHAAIRVHDADGGPKKRSFSLCDFGSSNGTFVQIRGESPLESGDEFRVGQQLFRVELSS